MALSNFSSSICQKDDFISSLVRLYDSRADRMVLTIMHAYARRHMIEYYAYARCQIVRKVRTNAGHHMLQKYIIARIKIIQLLRDQQ